MPEQQFRIGNKLDNISLEHNAPKAKFLKLSQWFLKCWHFYVYVTLVDKKTLCIVLTKFDTWRTIFRSKIFPMYQP